MNNNEVTKGMAAMMGGSAELEISMFQWDVAGKDLLYLYLSAAIYTMIVLGYAYFKGGSVMCWPSLFDPMEYHAEQTRVCPPLSTAG
eukprot:SAG22_NODE_2616_length_2375_cov_1.863357_4_plen_87_part_00